MPQLINKKAKNGGIDDRVSSLSKRYLIIKGVHLKSSKLIAKF